MDSLETNTRTKDYVLEIHRFVIDPNGHEDTLPLDEHWELVGIYSKEEILYYMYNGMPIPERPYGKVCLPISSYYTTSPREGILFNSQQAFRIRHLSYW